MKKTNINLICALLLTASANAMALDYAREISTNRDSTVSVTLSPTPIKGTKYVDAYTYSSVAGQTGCRGYATWTDPSSGAQCKSDAEVLLKHAQSSEVIDSIDSDAVYIGKGSATATCNNGAIEIYNQICKPKDCTLQSMLTNGGFIQNIPFTNIYSQVYDATSSMGYETGYCYALDDMFNQGRGMVHGEVRRFYDNNADATFGQYNHYNPSNTQGSISASDFSKLVNIATGYADFTCNNGSLTFNANTSVCKNKPCTLPANFNWDVDYSKPRRHQGEVAYERTLGGSRTGTYNNCKTASTEPIEIRSPQGAKYVIYDAENRSNYITLTCDAGNGQIRISSTVCD